MNMQTVNSSLKQQALRLLFVTPRYFPFIGGVENHVYQVSRRLSAAGVDVTVLTTDPGKNLAPYEEHEGVKIRRVPAWPAQGDLYFAPQVRKVILEGSWDLMHLQSYHTFVAPIAMSAARQAGLPYVVTFHGGGHSAHWRNAIRGLQVRSMRPLFAHAEQLVAIARFEIEHYGGLLHLSADRFVVIPNGADIAAMQDCPDQTSSQAKSHGSLIVSVGRLERYKGHQRILSAMPAILDQQPDTRLWIAGEGPYRPELEKLSEKLGVSRQVEIRSIPAKDRQQMVAELSKADLMVLLSEFETQPISVLEAAYLNLPILVADTTGLREMAEQGIARSVPLNSQPDQVAQAVLEQLAHPLKPAKVNFPTWDQCAADLYMLYRGIVSRE